MEQAEIVIGLSEHMVGKERWDDGFDFTFQEPFC